MSIDQFAAFPRQFQAIWSIIQMNQVNQINSQSSFLLLEKNIEFMFQETLNNEYRSIIAIDVSCLPTYERKLFIYYSTNSLTMLINCY